MSDLLQIVYVAREPKDAMISYYHHHRLWNGYTGTLPDFAEAFLADRGTVHFKRFYILNFLTDIGRIYFFHFSHVLPILETRYRLSQHKRQIAHSVQHI